MKMVKSLLLGSAAGLVAVAGAQAADLPVKAKPVEYVKICSLYGDGFYYIPGTDICLKVGGQMQADFYWNARGNGHAHFDVADGAQDRSVSAFSSRARSDWSFDARSQTPYGTLRAYLYLRIDNTDQNTLAVQAPRAFIQWAGWTVGHVKSLSDPDGIFGGGNGARGLFQGTNHSDTGANGNTEITYTWELGNGLSLTGGAAERRVKSITNLSVAGVWSVGAAPTTSIAGEDYPNPFAVFRINQAWGAASVTVVGNPIRSTYYTANTPGFGACNTQPGTTFCDYPSDKWGWATMFGTSINVPWISPGDRTGGYAQYSVGAGAYGVGNNNIGAGLFQGGNNVALGAFTDAVYLNGTGFELTTAWTAGWWYEHWWTPQFSTTVAANYTDISYNDTVVNNRWFCGGGGAAAQNVTLAATTSCDPGYHFWTAQTHIDWYPVPGFRLAVSALYSRVDMPALDGTSITLSKASGLRPTGTYTAKNGGIIAGAFRASREFPVGN